MAITWRPATRIDIESSLVMLGRSLGDALVGSENAVDGWRHLINHPACTATVLEAMGAMGDDTIVGFGAAAIVSSSFADAEAQNPQPDINSRIIACIGSGGSVLATR